MWSRTNLNSVKKFECYGQKPRKWQYFEHILILILKENINGAYKPVLEQSKNSRKFKCDQNNLVHVFKDENAVKWRKTNAVTNLTI